MLYSRRNIHRRGRSESNRRRFKSGDETCNIQKVRITLTRALQMDAELSGYRLIPITKSNSRGITLSLQNLLHFLVSPIPARITPFVSRITKLIPILLFVHLAVAAAQTTTGTLMGFISDPSGAALPGVSIVAVNAGTNVRRESTTDESGNYAITNLPPGVYNIHFQLTGFKPVEVKQVEVRINDNTRKDFQMEDRKSTRLNSSHSQIS